MISAATLAMLYPQRVRPRMMGDFTLQSADEVCADLVAAINAMPAAERNRLFDAQGCLQALREAHMFMAGHATSPPWPTPTR